NDTNDVQRSWALETSLRLAEEQLLATTRSLDDFVVVPDDEQEISEAQELSSLYVQQEELLEAAAEGRCVDEDATIRTSAAASAVDLSRGILCSIATCNEARKVAGIEE